MKDLILEYQNKWANGIVEIGKTKNNFEESSSITTKFINELYDFKNGKVQFKPTKASENQFRNDFDSALSYFIGNDPGFSEFSGFGSKWSFSLINSKKSFCFLLSVFGVHTFT